MRSLDLIESLSGGFPTYSISHLNIYKSEIFDIGRLRKSGGQKNRFDFITT